MSHPRLGVNGHQAGEPALQLAASLGISIVRIDANIADLWRAPDQWTWDWLDDMLAACRTLALQPYTTITQSARWMGVEPGDPPPLRYWVEFCETFARRYSDQITFVGCWNEFQGEASTYVTRLLRPMSEVFRRVDAGYRIVAPELQMTDHWDTNLLEILKRGGELIDVLSVHTYSSGGEGNRVWDKITKSRKWWEVWKDPSVLQVIAAAKESAKPLWLTETGFRSDELGEETQARAIDEILERVLGNNIVEKVFLFQLLDESPNGGHGIFRENLSEKPCVAVIRKYTSGII